MAKKAFTEIIINQLSRNNFYWKNYGKNFVIDYKEFDDFND